MEVLPTTPINCPLFALSCLHPPRFFCPARFAKILKLACCRAPREAGFCSLQFDLIELFFNPKNINVVVATALCLEFYFKKIAEIEFPRQNMDFTPCQKNGYMLTISKKTFGEVGTELQLRRIQSNNCSGTCCGPASPSLPNLNTRFSFKMLS